MPRCVLRHLPVSFERFHRGARTESGLAAATRDDCIHDKNSYHPCCQHTLQGFQELCEMTAQMFVRLQYQPTW